MSSSSEDVSVSGSDSSEEIKRRKKSKSKKSKHSFKSHKREKKSKKKHKRKRTPSSSEESSSEDEWVSKEDLKDLKPKRQKDETGNVPCEVKVVLPPGTSSQATAKDSQVQDDDWMNFDSVMATYSNDSKKTKRQKEKEAAREKGSIDQLGQSEQELNPYWKNGGKGLPSEDVSSSNSASKTESASAAKVVGDGGLSWLRKAFLRAKEQAKEEGKSLEEIAEERWGSLQSFYDMLEAAEEKSKQSNPSHSSRSRREDEYSRHSSSRRRSPVRFQRPRENSDSDDGNSSRHSRSHKSSSHHSSKHSRSYHNDNSPSRSSTHRSTGSGWRKPRDTESSSQSQRHRSSQSPDPESESKQPKIGREGSSDKFELENKRDKIPPKESGGSSSHPIPIPVDSAIEEDPKDEVKVLTDKEMNELSAKILKAELLGNESLVDTLKAKKVEADRAREEFIKGGSKETKPTKKVIKIVLEEEQRGAGPRRRVKEKPGETHEDGQRVRYFPDDDRQTLKNMYETEKRNTVENENALFARLAGKGVKANEDYDMDDIFTDKASSAKQGMKDKTRELREIIDEDKVYKKTLEGCNWCFDGNKLQKNLVVGIGEKSFLCLPPYQSLTDGHCLIVPMFHTSCATELDEDVWEEMQKFRKAIVNMFAENDEDVVIFETAVFLKKHPHMYLECVPMPKETGELAPIYFKKAIQECETEWSQNKKLVDLRNRNVRKAVPKGLPYFSVDFGMDSGFAHVIEDERYFPKNFAQEIVGGMLELDHSLWRKQKLDDFHTQRSKVMEFLKVWGPHDWTKK